MTGALLSSAIATGTSVGPQGPADARTLIATAAIIVLGMFAYIWVASRLVRSPSGPRGEAGALGRPSDRSEPEPIVDLLFRDLDSALQDRSLVREARRRVRASRWPRSPGPAR